MTTIHNQCARCGEDFGSLTAFDAHQKWSYGETATLICLSPSELGLVKSSRGCWSRQAPVNKRQRERAF